MKIDARVHYSSNLSDILIHSNGQMINVGNVDAKKPWLQRLWERIHFDERGLVTDTGVFALTTEFSSGQSGSNALAPFTYHASGTGATAAAVTDTTLTTELTHAAGAPSTRPAASSQTATGSSSTATATFVSVGTIAYTGAAAITEWGLFNSATISAGSLWDHRVFSAINVVSGDSIQFTYTLSAASGGT